MSKIEEVKKLIEKVEELQLEGREILSRFSIEELAEIYNGIGPECFPDWLRAVLDFLHPSLAPVAFLHDVEWHLTDGTEESFTASNNRFFRNGLKLAKAAFSAMSPRRYLVIWHAWKFARLCQRFGWFAWLTGLDAD